MVQLSEAQAARDAARKELVEERSKRAASEADARLVHETNEQVTPPPPSSLPKRRLPLISFLPPPPPGGAGGRAQ
jgi:hypothetical protein